VGQHCLVLRGTIAFWSGFVFNPVKPSSMIPTESAAYPAGCFTMMPKLASGFWCESGVLALHHVCRFGETLNV